MSGEKPENKPTVQISLEADEQLEEIKDKLEEEILEEAKKIAGKRGSDPNSDKLTLKAEDIQAAWEKIKDKKQGNR